MCSLANTNQFSLSSFSDTSLSGSSVSSSSSYKTGDRFISTREAANDMCNNFDTKSEIFQHLNSSHYYMDKSYGFGHESNQENQSGISNQANTQYNDENSRLYSTLL
jgi:DNA-binding transcriptional regulator YhcF (GntR family)